MLFYDRDIATNDGWDPKDFVKDYQVQSDLGGRMKKAFQKTLIKYEKAIIIGSDCPKISPEIIEDAFFKLDHADVVIGPTFDGGYYLLGIKRMHRFLFENMTWSTSSVFAETQMRIENNELTYSLVDTLSDLDTIDDLNTFPHLKSKIKDLL